MSITKQRLHELIDNINPSEYSLAFQILMKFVPEDEPEEDELEAIAIAEKEILNGELYDESFVDWD